MKRENNVVGKELVKTNLVNIFQDALHDKSRNKAAAFGKFPLIALVIFLQA